MYELNESASPVSMTIYVIRSFDPFIHTRTHTHTQRMNMNEDDNNNNNNPFRQLDLQLTNRVWQNFALLGNDLPIDLVRTVYEMMLRYMMAAPIQNRILWTQQLATEGGHRVFTAHMLHYSVLICPQNEVEMTDAQDLDFWPLDHSDDPDDIGICLSRPIQNLTLPPFVRSVYLTACNELVHLPDVTSMRLTRFSVDDCPLVAELHESIFLQTDLTILRLGGMPQLLLDVDRIIGTFRALMILDLSGSAIDHVPDTIHHMYCLEELDVSACDQLQSLPVDSLAMIASLVSVDARECPNLQLPHVPDRLINVIVI